MSNRRRPKSKGSNFNNSSKKLTNKKPVPVILGDYVFPIYGLNSLLGDLRPYIIFGTCFNIGGDYFLTALHVVEEAELAEQTQIGFLEQLASNCVNMSNYEVVERFPEADIALLCSPEINQHKRKPKAFKWSGKELLIFDKVRSMGFPYGFDNLLGKSKGRGFAGSILCLAPFKRGIIDANCYELSFQAPKGLSGGILLDESYRAHGLVIGNSQSSMHLFINEHITKVENEETKTIEETRETTFIGLAITGKEIFRLVSKTLGKSLHDHLIEFKLH